MEKLDEAPLIVTLELAKPAQDWAQQMRCQYFPPKRNQVPAHITLFHALPRATHPLLKAALSAPGVAPNVVIEAPYLLGRGVAYRIRSPEMAALRARLVEQIGSEQLTRQDAAPWRPHLTIQNKVSPDEAHALYATLKVSARQGSTQGAALRVWRYDNGPWTLLDRFAFQLSERRMEDGDWMLPT